MASGNILFGDIVAGMRSLCRPGNFARFSLRHGKGEGVRVAAGNAFPLIMVFAACTHGRTVTVKKKEFAIAYFVGTPSAGTAPGLCGPIVLTRRDGACCPR